ncbi:FUSC family protein [Enterococcus durans]|uniref:FUSC family protein n=1 Tax=Enterococcus durans TaxID=53345 RepID=UPI003566B8A5
MLKTYFRFNKIKDNPFRIMNLMILIFLVLWLGYINHNFLISSFSSLGLFTFFYYQNIPLKALLKRMFLIGCGLLIAFMLGVLSTYVPWLEPFVVAAVAFSSRFILRLFHISKPGGLFFAMLSAMGTSMTLPIAQLPQISMFFFMGVVFSLIAAIITKLLDTRPEQVIETTTLKERFHQDPLVIIDSVFYSAALFLSVYVSHGLNLHNPYWLTLSCASILLAENLDAMKHRQVQYLIGSMLGLIVSAILSLIPFTQLETIFLVTFLYGISQFLVARNYAVANIFLNPMALMLSTLMRNVYLFSLIEYRFLGILLGSFIGLGAAWVMNVGLRHYLAVVKNSLKE